MPRAIRVDTYGVFLTGQYYSNTAIRQVLKSLELEQTLANSPPACMRNIHLDLEIRDAPFE